MQFPSSDLEELLERSGPGQERIESHLGRGGCCGRGKGPTLREVAEAMSQG